MTTSQTDQTICSYWSTSWLFGTSKCEDAATCVIVVGCEHEHITRSASCDRCRANFQDTHFSAHCGLCCGAGLAGCTHGPGEGVPVKVLEVVPL